MDVYKASKANDVIGPKVAWQATDEGRSGVERWERVGGLIATS